MPKKSEERKPADILKEYFNRYIYHFENLIVNLKRMRDSLDDSNFSEIMNLRMQNEKSVMQAFSHEIKNLKKNA